MERDHSIHLRARHDGSSRVQKTESPADKMTALKARVAAAIGTSKAKGGLSVGLHPALEDLGSWKPPNKTNDESPPRAQQKQDGRRPQQGTAVTGGAATQNNPYLADGVASQASGGRQRHSRQLIFNQKGKYIQQANALRRQAALEAMKKRIAEQTRRAGIDEDIDVEKSFAVEDPPSLEWWDESLVDGKGYDDIEDTGKLKIEASDSIVTEYIQHPVALEPPQDRHIPEAKPMFLTSREQAKLRRQRRMAELKEMQAKIRLGLVPAPPPKVKKGNLMRVLGDGKLYGYTLRWSKASQSIIILTNFTVAVKDPTAVEAQVNREIAERYQKHLDINEKRKLSKEQRHEKLTANQQKDADKGVHVLVFKINSLANGQHRYRIGANAEQLALTGTCIMHPKFNLVVVEGGEWSIKKYRKLMLNRIDWTENAPSRNRDSSRVSVRDWLLAENDKGELKDMSLNECKLIFEGELKERGFRKWGSKVCETDAEARDVLARAKMDNFWGLAKGFN